MKLVLLVTTIAVGLLCTTLAAPGPAQLKFYPGCTSTHLVKIFSQAIIQKEPLSPEEEKEKARTFCKGLGHILSCFGIAGPKEDDCQNISEIPQSDKDKNTTQEEAYKILLDTLNQKLDLIYQILQLDPVY